MFRRKGFSLALVFFLKHVGLCSLLVKGEGGRLSSSFSPFSLIYFPAEEWRKGGVESFSFSLYFLFGELLLIAVLLGRGV